MIKSLNASQGKTDEVAERERKKEAEMSRPVVGGDHTTEIVAQDEKDGPDWLYARNQRDSDIPCLTAGFQTVDWDCSRSPFTLRVLELCH